jgi:organic hydroperoxide reductase OsmC/OhrA
MEKKHTYSVTAWWSSEQTGLAKSDTAPNAIHFAAPPQFGGLEGRWSPEDLLLSAVASCFTTTFKAIAGNSLFAYTDLEVTVEGTVEKTQRGYCFTTITIRPRLTIPEGQSDAKASELLKVTESLCLISRALTTPKKFEPRIEVREVAGSVS